MTAVHPVGRFAPTPSGPLHFGSLIAALGSWLHARAQGGQWLLRIEDLDPPREMPGAADSILRTLEAYQLTWDGPVVYQSQRLARYAEVLQQLQQQGHCYACDCTRAQIQAAGGFYPGTCRERQLPLTGHAIRLRQQAPVTGFTDLHLGDVRVEGPLASEDFILRRRDGLFAYNLAVVIDDADSGISEVVRGADLVEPTVRQIALYRLLQQPVPAWLHLPLALQADGRKWSKQNHAPALPMGAAITPTLWQALTFLGQQPPAALRDDTPSALLDWALAHWSTAMLPRGDHYSAADPAAIVD